MLVYATCAAGAPVAPGAALPLAIQVGQDVGTQLPAGALESISRTLGKDSEQYHVVPQSPQNRSRPTQATITNPAQHLDARFSAGGDTEVSSGDVRLRLSLGALGYGDQLRPVGAISAFDTADNEVSYRRDGVTEWFVNGPAGLQHGFTLTSPPKRSTAGALALEVGFGEGVRAQSNDTADGLTLVTEGGATIGYNRLTASDAGGRRLPAWFETREDRVLIRVDEHDARYPLTIDPLIGEAKLSVAGGGELNGMGWSVDIDGDTIVAGAPTSSSVSGVAYVFTRSAAGWGNAAVARLTLPGNPQASFGWSVAVDGDTIVVGAPDYSDGVEFSGGVFVFTEPATGWVDASPAAHLEVASPTMFDSLGRAVAIDGDTIVAGGDRQFVYVYAKPAGGWASGTQTAILTVAGNTTSTALGASVAVSGDTIVAGAPVDDETRGAAYVFVKPQGGWVDADATARLSGTSAVPSSRLGESVAVEGNTVVAGANGGGSTNQRGSVYVFVRPDSAWSDMTQAAELTASDGAESNRLGRSVSISGDTVVATASSAGIDFTTYVFTRPASGWANATETARLTPSDVDTSGGGSVAAIDGATVVVGDFLRGRKTAPGEGGVVVGDGRLYTYARAGTTWSSTSETSQLTSVGVDQNTALGFSVSVSGDTVVAGAPGVDGSAGAVYVYVRPQSGWTNTTQLARLTATDRAPGHRFGTSVAVSGDTVVVGAPGADSGAGASYVFEKPLGGWSDATQTARLVDEARLPDSGFGDSVAVDGTSVVVGAEAVNSVFVFVRPPGGWVDGTETAVLSPDDNEGTGAGASVAVMGGFIAAGAPKDSLGRGAVYVFVQPPGGWTSGPQTAKLTAAAGIANQHLGRSVALGDGGATVVAGAPDDDGAGAGGAVHVFVRPASGWAGLSQTSTAVLTAADRQPLDGLGASVVISGDTIAAGAPGNAGHGAVLMFVRSSSGWQTSTETERNTGASVAAGDQFGWSIAFSGTTLVVGAPGTDGRATDEGAVRVFGWSFTQPPDGGPEPPDPPDPEAPAPVFAATPGVVSFGTILPLANRVVRTVVIVNTGSTTLTAPTVTITAGDPTSIPSDYAVIRNGCAGLVAPGVVCSIDAAYSPSRAGPSPVKLTVASEGFTRTVALDGGGAAQVLRANPGVCRPGCVSTVTGEGFPPLWSVTIMMPRYGANQQPVVVDTDANGTFSARFLIFPSAARGTAEIVATAAGADISATARVLLVPGLLGPPEFLQRR